ncbi:MAG: adenylosuccinate lyase [Candidatus Krumholzibacteriales bacterium]
MISRYSVPDIEKIWTDKNKYAIWQEVEVLYCEGLAEYGYIPKKAARKIRARAAFSEKRIAAIEKKTRHDVIAFLTDMAEKIGPEGRYLHLGMTSSDLLDTAMACQLREAAGQILRRLRKLRTALKNQALRYKDLPMVGRSHGIHAEPITFGLKLLVWYSEVNRNIARMERVREEVSVGQITGAVGTMTHTDPRVERYVMKKLGLKPADVTTQIIQRDRHADFLSAVALAGGLLEKMAVEIRGLQRTEVGEVEEPFTSGQKGSSAMPHKRNPILTERISGMARILRANSVTAMENMALWHERDISHSSVERIIFPDSTGLLAYMTEKMTWIIKNMKIRRKAMKRNLEATGGHIFSQHVLLMLVNKGLSREEAYLIVQRAAMRSMESDKSFKQLLADDRKLREVCSEEELERVFDLQNHFRRIDYIFKRTLGKK